MEKESPGLRDRGGKGFHVERPQDAALAPQQASPPAERQDEAPQRDTPQCRYPEQARALREWWRTIGRTLFGTWAEFAKQIGVTEATVSHWVCGRGTPRGKHRQQLWERTHLSCFDPQPLQQARQEAKEERRRKNAAHASAWYRARQRRVSDDELERLRQRENRQEALSYAPEKKCVCLNCGGIFDLLSRHVSTCPVKPEPAPAYKASWGYNETNPLASAKWREDTSGVRRDSTKFQDAKKKGRSKTLAVFAAERDRQSAAKKKGVGIRRSPVRLEARIHHRGKGRGARLRLQKVSDERILQVLALGLTMTESAKRVGLSVEGFRQRARRLGWNSEASNAKKIVVIRYVFELRSWLRDEGRIPTFNQIVERHAERLRRDGSEMFRKFTPFLPSLKTELNKHPGVLRELVQRQDGGVAMTLASHIRQRANATEAALAGGPESNRSTRLPRKKRDLSRLLDSVSLTEPQRDCYSLRLEYELTISEIARRRGVDRKVVRKHIAAAKRRIDGERAHEQRARKRAISSPGDLREVPLQEL